MSTVDAPEPMLEGEYTLAPEPLARGAVTIVYRAYARRRDADVAVKLLNPAVATDRSIRGAFLAGYQALAQLLHPNVIDVYDYGEDDGRCFLAMRLAEGGSLRDLLDRAGRPGERPPGVVAAARLIRQVARALQFAHDRGLVHGDVRPDNILLGAAHWPLLADFAPLAPGGAAASPPAAAFYRAPEHRDPGGAAAGASAAGDQYALAATAYELLSGRRPFPVDPSSPDANPDGPAPADAVGEALGAQHRSESPVPLRALVPGLPRAVEAVVTRGLARDPADRFPSVGAFGDALAQAADRARGVSRATKDAAAALAPNLLGVVALVLLEPAILRLLPRGARLGSLPPLDQLVHAVLAGLIIALLVGQRADLSYLLSRIFARVQGDRPEGVVPAGDAARAVVDGGLALVTYNLFLAPSLILVAAALGLAPRAQVWLFSIGAPLVVGLVTVAALLVARPYLRAIVERVADATVGDASAHAEAATHRRMARRAGALVDVAYFLVGYVVARGPIAALVGLFALGPLGGALVVTAVFVAAGAVLVALVARRADGFTAVLAALAVAPVLVSLPLLDPTVLHTPVPASAVTVVVALALLRILFALRDTLRRSGGRAFGERLEGLLVGANGAPDEAAMGRRVEALGRLAERLLDVAYLVVAYWIVGVPAARTLVRLSGQPLWGTGILVGLLVLTVALLAGAVSGATRTLAETSAPGWADRARVLPPLLVVAAVLAVGGMTGAPAAVVAPAAVGAPAVGPVAASPPAPVAASLLAAPIAANQRQSVAVASDGSVREWGAILCQTFPAAGVAAPVAGVNGVAAGFDHALALTGSGEVWAWGNNWLGQLGTGAVESGCRPGAVPAQLVARDVVAISAGYAHSLALARDGTVLAWGENFDGEIGDGTLVARDAPVRVAGLTRVRAVAAGGRHSLALRDDGTVWAWGNNEFGQLGDATTTGRTRPVRVAGLTDAVAIAAGFARSAAIRSDGTVWTWGDESDDPPADWPGTRGAPRHWSTPALVPGLPPIAAVAVGNRHNLALARDGTVVAWGNNQFGQLGDGTTISRPAPVRLTTVRNVVAVAAGFSHSLAIEADGTVYQWGDDGTAGAAGPAGSPASTLPRPIFRLGPVSSVGGAKQ